MATQQVLLHDWHEVSRDDPGKDKASPCSCSDSIDNQIQVDQNCSFSKVKRNRSRRYGRSSNLKVVESSDGESDGNLLLKDLFSKRFKRSSQTVCSKEKKCEKIEALWRPDKACRPVVADAPVFYPTEEEFSDTIGYISSIRSEAEKYGICRIVPPSSWKPPCILKNKRFWQTAGFTTRLQQVDKLQNREPSKKKQADRSNMRKRRRKRIRFGMTRRRNSSNSSEKNGGSSDSEEKFGFQSGEEFTLKDFKMFADEFKQQYFDTKEMKEELDPNLKVTKSCLPTVDEIEGEYWRIVEEPTDEVEVHYGADLETSLFGSGFPKGSPNKKEVDFYMSSGWNLNNLPRLPGSILSFEEENISGVLVPWLYIGMCFSSFCWHVEDHHLYSLNYMHFGEPKVWYGVSGNDAVKLEEAMRKHLPRLFEEQPDLLHALVTQLSPSVLKSEDVPVHRVVQNPGEFVLTFPRAYHAGFNCGFNCAEAVNVAPVDWLPYGQCAVELYREQQRKTSISHDKLMLEAGKHAIEELYSSLSKPEGFTGIFRWKSACSSGGILTETIKARIDMERKARDQIDSLTQRRKLDKDDDSLTNKECFRCLYDLHLSAIGCLCSPNRFACLNHAECLCSCEPEKRFFLFRYSMDELETLVAALESDPDAVMRWAQWHLELTSA